MLKLFIDLICLLGKYTTLLHFGNYVLLKKDLSFEFNVRGYHLADSQCSK